MKQRSAIVVGSGPNGLAAAIEMARSGWRVSVFEADHDIGGGTRSRMLTLPGFVHDVCSAVHPLAVATRYFPSLPLQNFGLEWIHSPLELAHPFDDGSAAILERSGERTAERLGDDIVGYRRLIAPAVKDWKWIEAEALRPPAWPHHTMALLRFGVHARQSAERICTQVLKTREGRALFAGVAAHAGIPLSTSGSAAVGMILTAAAHRAGWPLPRGGAQSIANALSDYLREQGGEIITGRPITALGELPEAEVVLFDTSPEAMVAICGERLPRAYRSKIERFERGAGVCKMDWALSGPIPWSAPECGGAATVHLGGTFEEIAESESMACTPGSTRVAERPFVLLAQPSLFDPSRAPAGQHTAWAYCHVPNGSDVDMSERIERQVERFAPGFTRLILARSTHTAVQMQQLNPNLVGGDVNGGSARLMQLLRRPTWSAYSTPARGIYLCSASTPPGGGVHGLCGMLAAHRALAENSRI